MSRSSRRGSRRLAAAALAITASMFLASCADNGSSNGGGESADSGSSLKIGMVTTLSGPGSYLGQDIRDAFLLAAEMEGGRLGGAPVQVGPPNPDLGCGAPPVIAGGRNATAIRILWAARPPDLVRPTQLLSANLP